MCSRPWRLMTVQSHSVLQLGGFNTRSVLWLQLVIRRAHSILHCSIQERFDIVEYVVWYWYRHCLLNSATVWITYDVVDAILH